MRGDHVERGEEEERKRNHQTRAELSRPDCMRL